MTTLPRPRPTDLLGDAAAAIRYLAETTDQSLGLLAVVIVPDTKATTNANGDVALAFPGIGPVAGVVMANVNPSAGTPLQQIQVPVWGRVRPGPDGWAWMRAISTISNAALANHPVRFVAIGWGVPG
jgi:hypothetical protein